MDNQLYERILKKIELKTKIYEPLSLLDIEETVKKLKIDSFITCSKNTFATHPSIGEGFQTAIINLDDPAGPGSHWVAVGVVGKSIFYFDSYGDSYPPEELNVKGYDVFRNLDVYQTEFDAPICGHLCLCFCYLFHITRGDASRVLEEMRNKDKLLKFVSKHLVG